MTYDANFHSDSLMFIARAIATRGLAVMNVGSGQCSAPGCICEPEAVPRTYTIGLVERHHPEVVTLGMASNDAVAVLNWIHDRDVAGDRLQVNQIGRFQGRAVRPVPVPTAWVTSDDDPLGQWFAHYGIGCDDLEPPVVWQLLWADEHDRFPGQVGCRKGVDELQPCLSEHPTWRPGAPHPASRRRLRVLR